MIAIRPRRPPAPWLVQLVDAHGDMIRRAVIKMNSFTLGRDDFARLQQELDTMLFMAVRTTPRAG